VAIERGFIKKLLRPLVTAAAMAALFAAMVTPGAARAPLFEGRGVLTLAPVLERATLAVVSVAVASRVPANDNPLLRDLISVALRPAGGS